MDLFDDIMESGGPAADDVVTPWPFAEDAFFEQMHQAAPADEDGPLDAVYAVETLEQAQARIGDRLADLDDAPLTPKSGFPDPTFEFRAAPADAPAVLADDPFVPRPAVDDLFISAEADDFVLGRDVALVRPGDPGMERFQAIDAHYPPIFSLPSIPADDTLGGPAQTLHLWVQDDWLF
jgi:hypothetical protein